MYKNLLIAVIQVDNKILRENSNNEVFLPFNTEYSILLKNNHKEKIAFVNIEIDGDMKTTNSGLMVKPGESLNFSSQQSGFLNINSKENHRKFKFIEKTQRIIDYKGDNIDDGFIKISFRYGKKKLRFHQPCFKDDMFNLNVLNSPKITSNVIDNKVHKSLTDNKVHDSNISFNSNVNSNSINDMAFNQKNINGITVEGSEDENHRSLFQIEGMFINDYELEPETNVMMFSLKGLNKEEQISAPIFTKDKKICPSCGKKFKSDYIYCPYDTTYLRTN